MTKKKVIFIAALILICAVPLFAVDSQTTQALTKLRGTWVNAPFVKLLEQFGGLEHRWIAIARDIAVLTFLGNLIFSCLKVAFGTMEVRKAVVGNITKWCLFLVIMCFYPAVNGVMLRVSQGIARKVSGGWDADIGSNLSNYFEELYKIVKTNGNERSTIVALKNAKIQEYTIQMGKDLASANANGGSKTYTEYDSIGAPIEVTYSTAQIEKMWQDRIELAKLELKKAQDLDAGDLATQTYNILNSIFQATLDGGGKVTGWSIALNCYFSHSYDSMAVQQSATGKKKLGGLVRKTDSISIISPDSFLKCIYLCAAVMWEREWSVINQDWIDNQEETKQNAHGLEKIFLRKFTIFDFPFIRIAELLLVMEVIFMMVICGSTAIIQYMMCMLEYMLVVGAGAILIPFMLFDGLQDIAQRLITTIFQQALKLIFCVMMMYFAVWCFMELTNQVVGSITGFSIQNFIFANFICLVGAAFVANAPKIAQALFSGTPQMSMGEVAQMGATLAAGARFDKNAIARAPQLVTKAGKLARDGKEAVRKTGQWGIKKTGNIASTWGARSGAYKAARDSGASRKGAVGQAFEAGFRNKVGNMAYGVSDSIGNFFKGGKTGSGGGGGGGAGNSTAGLNETGRKAASSNYEKGSMYDYNTAQAHNKNYGRSMHYEKNEQGHMVATRQQTIGEHLKTQFEDAKKAHYERYKEGYEKIGESKQKDK